MQTIRITTSQNIDIDYEAASLGDRILGYLIDAGIFIAFYILVIVVGLLGMDGFGNIGMGIPLVMVLLIFFYAFYDLVLEILMNGQSVGKRVMKTRVISLDGGRPTIGQYLIRWLLRILDFSMSGGLVALIMVIVTEKKQRIGDMAAGTVVIKTISRILQAHLVFTPPGDDYIPVFGEVTLLDDTDVALIHEVLANYVKSRNVTLLHNMAKKIKEHLSIVPPPEMSDFIFLQTILKDYNKWVADLPH